MFKQAGTITIRGALDLDASIKNGVDPEGLVDKAFAGHDFTVRDITVRDKPVDRPVPYREVEKTTLVVLPPISCSDDHELLSQLVSDDLKDVEERVETALITPKSLKDVQTHQGLLDAMARLRTGLGGLAARWDDPDPSADPADPIDMDTPPNIFRVPIVILNAQDLNGVAI